MENLSEITGVPTLINLDVYKKAQETFMKGTTNILILLSRMAEHGGQIKPFLATLNSHFKAVDLEHAIQPRPKNPKMLDVADNYLPRVLITTDWFKDIRKVESEIYRTFKTIFGAEKHALKTDAARHKQIEERTWDDYGKLMEKQPLLVGTAKFLGIDIGMSEEVFNYVKNIHKYASQIVNVMMRPMYNVREKIAKEWDKRLQKFFKPIMAKNKDINRDLVIDLLTQFVNAKYRNEITGNPKFFAQMLSDGSEGFLAGINGARFLEVMDSINTDELAPGSKAKNFTDMAKSMMYRLVKEGDTIDSKIIMDVQAIIDADDLGSDLSFDLAKVEELSLIFHREDDEGEKV